MKTIARLPYITALAILLASAAGVAAAQESFNDLMTRVDYHYTMALFNTSEKNAPKSEAHVRKLAELWDQVALRYAEDAPAEFASDDSWSEAVADIAGAVRIGELHVRHGDLATAHEDLERVRLILRDLRERNGVPTLADKLTTYHDPMERIVLTAKNAASPAEAVESIRKHVPELQEKWEAVSAFYEAIPEGALKNGLTGAVTDEAQAVARLKKTLSSGDNAATLKSAMALKPPFAKLFIGQAEISYRSMGIEAVDNSGGKDRMELDYTVETAKSVDEAAAEVERLSAEKGFRVLVTHDISATLKGKGFDQPPMKIIEICNAKHAYAVLQADPKISLMLPCPISVYEQDGKTYISTLLPTAMSQMYPQAGIYQTANEVERVMREIVDEAK